jgi:hypothetical protein
VIATYSYAPVKPSATTFGVPSKSPPLRVPPDFDPAPHPHPLSPLVASASTIGWVSARSASNVDVSASSMPTNAPGTGTTQPKSAASPR